MKRLTAALALFLGLSAPVLAQGAAPQEGPSHVAARLVAEQASARPGGVLTIALEQVIAPGWHTYWVNPGDVGQATTIDWNLPPGWSADALQWPAPSRLPVASFMDYGYEGKVWLLATIAVPETAKPEMATIKATAHFLVCQQICVPQDSDLTLNMKLGDGAADPAVARDFAAARAALPVASPWKITRYDDLTVEGKRDPFFYLKVAAPALVAAHPISATFFPLTPGLIKGSASQLMGFTDDGLVLRLSPADKYPLVNEKIHGWDGVLVLKSSDGSTQTLAVDEPSLAGIRAPLDFSSAGPDISLWLAILFAFIGGLILNAMPCVLPILAMKALALASYGGGGGEAKKEGFAYCAGAVLSFVVFGLVIVVLRQTGQAAGWGFQLQNPVAVGAFALLIFAVGLNLSGLFEFGAVTAGSDLTARSGRVGAFFTGVLAVAVAAPCTAPFMAAALGFALTQSVLAALLIFLALGLGFALPFLILGLWPQALSFLPKPGPWMLRLKQVLAFPMYGAAAWLTWVLAAEAGANGVAVLLAAFVALTLAAWLWSITRGMEGRGRGIGAAAALIILAAALCGLTTLSGMSAPAPGAAASAEKFSPGRLASLRAAGQPVFVDATAAWCITCLVNEQAVLSRPPIKEAFQRKHVVYLVADWTNRSAGITQLLDQNGRSGVPLYLYYAPGAQKPVILPQILTEAGLLSAIGSAT